MSAIPLVSVVTPFYNTAAYLANCIESVLAQSYTHYEYILVNNQSTDGSREIALHYAQRDPRIRLVDNDAFVGQVENYNGALERVDPRSKYVKIVQADDALFPDGLRLLVDVAERDARIGLVGSFYLEGDRPSGGGIPHDVYRVAGRDVCRRVLLEDFFPLGSPTTVLYRADIVRSRKPFYALGHLHEDTEAALEILLEHDFGHVHQVCSFMRTDNISISSEDRDFNPNELDFLILLERYGAKVLSPEELKQRLGAARKRYFGFLAVCLLRRRSEKFWRHHERGLASIGHGIDRLDLLRHIPYGLLRAAQQLASDPGRVLQRGLRELRQPTLSR